NPPHALRCGVARGRVYSIGDGNDFVGPCINIAARLQKVASGITFCFSRRGFDGEKFSGSTKELLLRRISIRGIGNSELVYVPRAEYEALSGDDKALLEEP
ncbi:MAG TPA: hypothetical protein VEZ11_08035, partial [Thermoanaerobaculia bacterium]|nr:hypothetical protein [Thermoanaerobaculia bacterium]